MKKLTAVLTALLCAAGISAYAQTDDTSSRYTFDETLSDAASSGSIEYADGIIDKCVHFSDEAYLTLPSDAVSDMTDFTISAWVNPDSVSDWARVFDFGTGTNAYMFLTLSNDGDQTVFAITSSGSSNEQKVNAPCVFEAGAWTHIAVAKTGNTAVMYADGIEVGRNESITLSPSSIGASDSNYIAKSQYSADPYYSGYMDDFRIYSRGLSADEIAEIAGEPNSEIVSIEDTQIYVRANSEAELPEYRTAVFSDGSERSVRIVWDSFDESLLLKDGSFTVNGSVVGSDISAKAEIIVTSDSVVDGLSVTSEIYSDSGTAYSKYTVNNETDISYAVLYNAVYCGGILKSVGVSRINNFISGEYTVSADIPDEEDILVKSYLWDKEMNPLAEAAQKSFSNPYGSSFEVGEVTLTDGIFKDSQDTGKAVLLSLDVDRLLAPVAYSAGAITDQSEYYGGWEAYNYRGYKGKGISGHSLGHWLSASSTMYAATGDTQLKDRVDYAVEKLAEYQALDGTGYIGGFERTGFESALSGTLSVSAFDLNGYWVPWYSLHKIYQGLIDAYELADNEQALEVVCAFADWAKNVTDPMSDDDFNTMLQCEYGGMNEVMAELYDITGKKDYLDLAQRFCDDSLLTSLSEGTDELQGKHANTQIPKVIGAATIYEQDEDMEEYRAAAEFFYDTVVNNRSYCIGGNSNYEHFGTVTEEVLGTQTCETCNTYNMMKLTEHLYSWDHNPEYMDYYERALFNHILASQDPDTGMKTYFMSTKPGHFKVYSTLEDSFWCCVGSGMENPGRYTRNIYYKDNDDFYVNLFISSEVEWKEKGLKISQTTSYPYEETTTIKIEDGSASAAVNIRIPSWIASAAKIRLNGGDEITVSESGYYTIERVWQAGDTIEVTLPMGLHIYTARDSENKVAFMYGPVVLAGELGTDSFPSTDLVSDHTSLDSQTSVSVPDIIVDDKTPDTFIKAVDISRLEFELTTDDASITLIPYFDLHHERYSLYWNLYSSDEDIEKDEFSAALDDATIDTVRPNEQQPEVDHSLQSNNSFSGYFETAARGWRDARGADGYFSYEMDIDSTSDCYVAVMYWGSDAAFSEDGVSYTREFNILVDDTVIGGQTLDNNSPGNLFYVFYSIPSELIDGKDTVTIKFAPSGENKAAGGVFEVRTTTAEVTQ